MSRCTRAAVACLALAYLGVAALPCPSPELASSMTAHSDERHAAPAHAPGHHPHDHGEEPETDSDLALSPPCPCGCGDGPAVGSAPARAGVALLAALPALQPTRSSGRMPTASPRLRGAHERDRDPVPI